jgi:hypothetical protein
METSYLYVYIVVNIAKNVYNVPFSLMQNQQCILVELNINHAKFHIFKAKIPIMVILSTFFGMIYVEIDKNKQILVMNLKF